MQHTLVLETTFLDDASRTVVESIVGTCDERKSQLFETVPYDFPRSLRHVAVPPRLLREGVAQHEAIDVAPLRISDETDRADARTAPTVCDALEHPEYMWRRSDFLDEKACVLKGSVRCPARIRSDVGIAAVCEHILNVILDKWAQHKTLGGERRAFGGRFREQGSRHARMPCSANGKADSHLLLIEHANTFAAQQPSRHAIARNESSRKGAVIDAAVAAGGAFRLEDSQRTVLFTHALECFLSSRQESVGVVGPSASITRNARSNVAISFGGCGARMPPSVSGQTGMSTCSSPRASTSSHGFAAPSYRHSTPNKHALTAIFIALRPVRFLVIVCHEEHCTIRQIRVHPAQRSIAVMAQKLMRHDMPPTCRCEDVGSAGMSTKMLLAILFFSFLVDFLALFSISTHRMGSDAYRAP